MPKKGYIPKKRNTGSRPSVKIVVFSLEGKNQTERIYLDDMKNDFKGTIRIKYAYGNETDPVSMMEALLQKIEDLELEKQDLAFSLVDSDCDPSKDRQIQEADRIARSFAGVKVRQIVSSPCFELWYLLHFEYTTAQFKSSSDVVNLLRKKWIKDYTKSKDGIYDLLRKDQGTACSRAQRLKDHCKKSGAKVHTTAFTPSTEMHTVIDDITNIAW